jgi:hypothetical protein
MLINYSKNERWSSSSSSWMSLCGGTMDVGWRWKRTPVSGGAPMTLCSCWEECKIETLLSGVENDQDWDDIFIVVEGGNRAVRWGWATTVVRIQYFDFGSRGETMGWSVAWRWSGGNKLVLAPWKENVTWRGGVAMPAEGEVTSGRGNRGDDSSWTDTNLTGLKNKENQHSWFNYYKWTVKI